MASIGKVYRSLKGKYGRSLQADVSAQHAKHEGEPPPDFEPVNRSERRAVAKVLKRKKTGPSQAAERQV